MVFRNDVCKAQIFIYFLLVVGFCNSGYIFGQSISVSIGGDAPITGTFSASPSERFDQFISRVFQTKSVKYALRDIKLKRINGDTLKIDLAMFYQTGNFSYNPMLKNEDVIIFPAYNMVYNFVTISGAVMKSGKYFFVAGDYLSTLLILANGVNPVYENVTEAEIARLSYDGTKEDIFRVKISDDFKLNCGDRVKIIAEENHRRDFGVYTFGGELIGQSIPVSIGGDAPITGTFTASSSERVDQFISRIFQTTQTKYSLRDIKLKRVSGDTLEIDLAMFYQTGNYAFNPTLKNEDILIFPTFNLIYNFVSISGAVKKSGKYFFVEGDDLSTILTLASGINPVYENVTEAEISRLSYDGKKEDIIRVKIADNVKLKCGDRVKILAEENYRRDYGVYVFGEIKNPGLFSITKEKHRLSELLSKAGGVLSETAGKNAIIYRSNDLSTIFLDKEYNWSSDQPGQVEKLQSGILDQLNRVENNLFLRTSNLDEEDVPSFTIETWLKTILDQDRVSLNNYADTNSEAGQFLIKNGDHIYIPPAEKFIKVFGQVSEPGRVRFVPGKDVSYYIDKCKGTSDLARNDIMIIKGETKEWIPARGSNTNLLAGDYIFIPKKVLHPFSYYVDLTAKYFGIVGGLATTLLLILQFTKK